MAALWIVIAGVLSASPSYVQADLIRVRKEPSVESSVEGVVRINTPLQVEATQGDWSRVRHAEPKVEGWVLTKFLATQPLTVAGVEAQLAKADGASRVGLLEQLVALEPNRKERYPPLLEAYRAAGKKERAAFLEKLMGGQFATYVGACVSNAVLLGHLRKGKWNSHLVPEVPRPVPDGGTAQPAELRLYDAPEAEPLWNVAFDVANLHWAPVGGETRMAGLGTLFPDPGLGTIYPDMNMEDVTWAVELGASCPARTGLWASAPFETVKLSQEQLRAVNAKAGSLTLQFGGGRVRLTPSGKPEEDWIRPLFGDGTLVTVRALSGSKTLTHYFATELLLLSPDLKVRRHVLIQRESLE